jgi:BirA family biotin operon repressor/biotin-[acetyl-CoA-carboxylase] ligase
MDVSKLQEGLRTRNFGRSIFFTHCVESTNGWAKELALLGAAEGTVAIARCQTHGRGRLGREWFSPVGGLWFSIVLRPEIHPSEVSRLVFVAGVAVADALSEACGLRVETKWPNDVLVNGRKVCGILAEAEIADEKVDFVVVGIGINTGFRLKNSLPKDLWDEVTSLGDDVSGRVHSSTVFRVVLEKLEFFYQIFSEEGFIRVLEAWKCYAGFLGKRAVVVDGSQKYSGVAIGVESDGTLSLRFDDGSVRRFVVGDVSLGLHT